jgi:hypothetical protein
MKTKAADKWKGELLKKLDILALSDVMETLRLHRVTVSISSIEPFDPKADYCEPFNHDVKYRTQVWDDDTNMYGKAFYGKTPGEAFRKAVRSTLEKRRKG